MPQDKGWEIPQPNPRPDPLPPSGWNPKEGTIPPTPKESPLPKEYPQPLPKESPLPKEYPLPISGPLPDIIDDLGDIEDELDEIKAALYCSLDKVAAGTIISPQAVFTSRPQIPLLRADGDLVITRIHIKGPGTSVLAGDLKYADDLTSFAGATLIQVCDTTGGTFTITSGITDDTVPAGKYIYFQLDSSPAADWTDFYIEVYYT